MKLYYSLLTVTAILWGFNTSILAAPNSLPVPQSTHISQKLLNFNAISVRGPINLIIEQTHESSQNFLELTDKQKNHVNVSVKDGVLYLQANPSIEPIVARVGVGQLNQLIVDDGASVQSKQLTSTSLSIDAHTSGSIELLGMITLERLLSSGSGPIHIQWIDSPSLNLEGSGHSQIELAGVAGAVEMRLRDNSQFQGKYLRIDQIFIQTKNFSTAKLMVNNSLRAFAYDHSNIYYYKKPAELTELTVGSGNILQLDWKK